MKYLGIISIVENQEPTRFHFSCAVHQTRGSGAAIDEDDVEVTSWERVDLAHAILETVALERRVG